MWVLPGDSFLVSVVIAVGMYFTARHSRWNPGDLKLVLAYGAVIYLLIIASVFAYEAYLDHKIAAFDLDGDGFFSAEESTEEYVKCWEKIMDDVGGRTYAPVLGLPFALFCAGLFLVALRLISFILDWVEQTRRGKPGL